MKAALAAGSVSGAGGSIKISKAALNGSGGRLDSQAGMAWHRNVGSEEISVEIDEVKAKKRNEEMKRKAAQAALACKRQWLWQRRRRGAVAIYQ